MPPPRRYLPNEYYGAAKPTKATDGEPSNHPGVSRKLFGDENIPPNRGDEKPSVESAIAVRKKTSASPKPSTQPSSAPNRSFGAANSEKRASSSSVNGAQAGPPIFGTVSWRSPDYAPQDRLKYYHDLMRNDDTEAEYLDFLIVSVNERGECTTREPEEASAQPEAACGNVQPQEIAQREEPAGEMTPQQRSLMADAMKDFTDDEPEDQELLDRDTREQLEREAKSITAREILQRANRLYRDFKIWIDFDVPRGQEEDLSFMDLTDHHNDRDLINRGWGEAAFMLKRIATLFECKFRLYEVIPCGARSCIKPVSAAAAELPLYIENGADQTTKAVYNRAQAAFVQCMYELGEHLRIRYSDITLKVQLDGGCDIERLENEPRRSPSRVLKLMLVNIKHILTHFEVKFLYKMKWPSWQY